MTGLLILMVVIALLLVTDVLLTAGEIAPLATISNQQRWLGVIAAGHVCVPLVVASALASALYMILPSGMSEGTGADSYFTPSPIYAGGVVAGAVLAGLLLSAVGAWLMARAGQSWRPGKPSVTGS